MDMNLLATQSFAAQVPTLLPNRVSLPAGFVKVWHNGRVYEIAGRIVAVGISPTVFLVSRFQIKPPCPSALLEQLAGFLVGREATVIRTDIHCFHHPRLSLSLEPIVLFWMKRFLQEGWNHRLRVALPCVQGWPIILPLTAATDVVCEFWKEAMILLDALEAVHSPWMSRLRCVVWKLAQDWEQGWNETLEHSKDISSEDWMAVSAVDRAWHAVVRSHLEPYGYKMSPNVIARLL